MADIFISYARVDRERIEELAASLEAQGYSAWWDRHIEGGAEFSKDIERELAAAAAVIVVWTKASINSRWVKDEAGLAAEAGKLVAISFDGSLPPLGFKQFHTIDFGADENAAQADVIRSVAAKVKLPAGTPSTSFLNVASDENGPAQNTGIATLSKKSAGAGIIVGGVVALLVAIFTLSGRGGDQQRAPSTASMESLAQSDNAVAAVSVGEGSEDAALGPINSKSIAVLPFANRSPNPDHAFFVEGVHDELLTHLSKITDMHVTSRTSVMQYADTVRVIPEIGRELGVATVMEGAVQRAGNRVRINVQLIDAQTDAHLWAEIYDRELTAENIFDIQSEITIAIAAALKSVLTADDEQELTRTPTTSLAAYDAYLRGKALAAYVGGTRERLLQAVASFEEAIVADSEFAIAYAAKAEAQLDLHWRFRQPGEDWVALARDDLRTADALESNSVETAIAYGWYYYWGFKNYELANEYINRALALAPGNANIWNLKGSVSRRLGEFDDSIDAYERSLRLDPLSVSSAEEVISTYMVTGHLEEARRVIEKFRALFPEMEEYYNSHANYWIYRGQPEKAWALYNVDAPHETWRQFELNRAYFSFFSEDSELILRSLDAVSEDQSNVVDYPEFVNIFRADALWRIGRKDEANKLAREIIARLEEMENPYPKGWSQSAWVWPVWAPGLAGDLEAVRAVVEEYEANRLPDEWQLAFNQFAIALAFVHAGDPDAAFDYLERSLAKTGPARFAFVKYENSYDAYRNHPRYIALDAKYEAWRVENGFQDLGD